jgi:hypothetical protein
MPASRPAAVSGVRWKPACRADEHDLRSPRSCPPILERLPDRARLTKRRQHPRWRRPSGDPRRRPVCSCRRRSDDHRRRDDLSHGGGRSIGIR